MLKLHLGQHTIVEKRKKERSSRYSERSEVQEQGGGGEQ